MKKGWLMLLFLLLPVMAWAELQVEIESPVMALGDPIAVQVTGGEGDLCRYTLLKGEKTLFEGAAVPHFGGILHPREEGDYTLLIHCGEESARAEFTVSARYTAGPGGAAQASGGLHVKGFRGTVMQQGDVLQGQILSDGPWMARTDCDFIQLQDNCGASGDVLTVLVPPAFEKREGNIILTSGTDTLILPVRQLAVHDVEEEVSFEPITDEVFIDGERVDSWFAEDTEAFFSVDATGLWTVETEGDFLTVTREEGGFTLRVQRSGEVQKGSVKVTCGLKDAYLYVFSVPETAGPDVLEVFAAEAERKVWQEMTAEVRTTSDAAFLQVSAAGHDQLLPAKDYAREEGGALVWQVHVPMKETGEQTLLFAARNEQGSGKKATLPVIVLPEDEWFLGEEARFITARDYHHLQFTAVSSADKVTLTDGRGNTLAEYTAADARLTPAGPEGQKNRYLTWDLALPGDMLPEYLLMGDERIPVAVQTVLTPDDIQLHSQTDGWWRDKKYSISQLEQSGCAVFTLSHALQLLGYTGEEIRPETLAKTYAVALMKDGSGTMNSTLVGRAGDDFKFKTRYQLYENPSVIQDKARGGAVFSFSVVNGHIACVARVLEEEGKCLIIDSAPSATFERKGDEPVYIRLPDGVFKAVDSPAEIPGVSYCIETDSFSCAVYYMDLSYVARRGVRLIGPE
ncbi:MAG: BACON domain-containing protein [Clostridia bacterium]|nr:BACON domain-containing protein [Clostridia bacterium]